MKILTFDIGGTHLRAGVYDKESDRLLDHARCRVPGFMQFPGLDRRRLCEKLYAQMLDLAHQVGLERPTRIGVAFPGPVDRGKVLRAPTLWGRGEVNEPLAAQINAIWPHARVAVFNDLTAAGYSFVRQPAEDLCVVTVSSGVGHKLFAGGRPIVGPRSRGGEIGHWRVEWGKNAPICDCGGIGHLGAVASGRAIAWQVRRLVSADPAAYAASIHGGQDPLTLSNQAIAAAFRYQDPWTRTLINAMAEPLGRALAAVHLTAGTERFVVMGGFAHALGLDYLKMLSAAAAAAAWEPGSARAWQFELGEIGDNAGLLGCGRLLGREINTA
jgi:predicted NBD/HSP70 family sugar kinase